MKNSGTFTLDGKVIEFREGDTIMDAALRAGVYIPHLCHNPEFKPHGSCRVCLVSANGRKVSACTQPAAERLEIESECEEIQSKRRSLLQMLFVEGNHVCPGCEKSGSCQLQAVAYYTGMLDPHFPLFFPRRELDASHADILLDTDRCILCELCVRASRDVDGKNVFSISGRGIHSRLTVNSPTGLLGDSTLAAGDKAAQVCPVGAILPKHTGFSTPIGERLYDKHPIGASPGQEKDGHG